MSPREWGRDLRLQELLAQAQAQSLVLAQQAGARRAKEASLRGGRERLLFTRDQILAADSGGKLPLSQRLLGCGCAPRRSRRCTVPPSASPWARRCARRSSRSRARPYNSARRRRGDDPQILRERADLLRDSPTSCAAKSSGSKCAAMSSATASACGSARRGSMRICSPSRPGRATSQSSAGGNRESAATTTLGTPAPTAPGSFDKDTFTGPIPSAGSNVRSTLDPSVGPGHLQRGLETLTDPVAKRQARCGHK